MNNSVESSFSHQLDTLFTQLHPQAVEEFYTAYQQWALLHRAAELRQHIALVRQQQIENEQRVQQAQPSAIALAALARLQSNGVSDIDLLDAMLERGEQWLDQTMQRLDYCEQFSNFISDDYTLWCQRALEGAFEWIDPLLNAPAQEESSTLDTSSEVVAYEGEDAGAVEALLLQKLATEEEDDLSWQEITLKQTAIQQPQEEMDNAPFIEFSPTNEPDDNEPALDSENEQPALVEFPAQTELSPVEETIDGEPEQTAPTEIKQPEDIPAARDAAPLEVSEPAVKEKSATAQAAPTQEQPVAIGETSAPVRNRSIPQKRGWMQRLIGALLGQ
ncbi:MAG TPA: hypothetical protein VNE38_20420 [Ktedonobacteraceae bacterium]|nr:hypothetical protein [Ktedonobacteraceae bacterium]